MAFKRSNVPGEDIKLAMGMTAKRRQLIDETPATPLVYEYGVNRLAKALHPGYRKPTVCAHPHRECGQILYSCSSPQKVSVTVIIAQLLPLCNLKQRRFFIICRKLIFMPLPRRDFIHSSPQNGAPGPAMGCPTAKR